MPKLKVLITVKTYPIPSTQYDELVCTAGVTESGDFVRLYPVRFRDLPYSQQYRKYQWIEVEAEKHTGRDSRKESWRPKEGTLQTVGDVISTSNGTWSKRAQFVLAKQARSMEDLYEQQKQNDTSLGIFRPKRIIDLKVTKATDEWKASFRAHLAQHRLWDDREHTKKPPRKVPWKFQYRFECEDDRCKGNHCMMIEDWEVGALYWRCIDGGDSPEQAAVKVKERFFGRICAPERDTYFFVGTVLEHRTWVIIGVFYPKKEDRSQQKLFE